MRQLVIWLCLMGGVLYPMMNFAADRQLPHWNGRLAENPTPSSPAKPADGRSVSQQEAPAADVRRPATDRKPEEPAWLRRLDQNDRTTLTGGWGLQNLSGGRQALTTAGDRHGYYAPNTYQGAEYHRWNHISSRQDVPSWNGQTATFPSGMWSQGYTSPNSYFGANAQRWGNLSAGGMSPNALSGGWSMSPWP